MGFLNISQHVGRHDLPLLVVTVGIVGLQHPQPVLDGDAGRHGQKSTGEDATVRAPDSIDRLPGDQHRHDGGFTCAGREFERQSHQLRVCLSIRTLQMRAEFGRTCPHFWGDLGQPDGRLNSLDLAEEGFDALEVVRPPMLEQPGGLGRNQPLIGIGKGTPGFDVGPNLIDDRLRVVFLIFRRQSVLAAEHQLSLALPPLLRLRDRGDQIARPAPLEDPLRRLAVVVQLPMATRIGIRGVQDRMLEKLIRHGFRLFLPGWVRVPKSCGFRARMSSTRRMHAKQHYKERAFPLMNIVRIVYTLTHDRRPHGGWAPSAPNHFGAPLPNNRTRRTLRPIQRQRRRNPP